MCLLFSIINGQSSEIPVNPHRKEENFFFVFEINKNKRNKFTRLQNQVYARPIEEPKKRKKNTNKNETNSSKEIKRSAKIINRKESEIDRQEHNAIQIKSSNLRHL